MNRSFEAPFKGQASTTVRHESRVLAITSYFNFDDPPGVTRRLHAYREFRRHLRIPLLTVELAHYGNFELSSEDAELLIHVA